MTKSPAPIDSTKVEDTGEPVAFYDPNNPSRQDSFVWASDYPNGTKASSMPLYAGATTGSAPVARLGIDDLQTQIDVLTALREGDALGIDALKKERDELFDRCSALSARGDREFHEAAVKLVRDMMDAMLAEKSWGESLSLCARVNALLTAPVPPASHAASVLADRMPGCTEPNGCSSGGCTKPFCPGFRVSVNTSSQTFFEVGTTERGSALNTAIVKACQSGFTRGSFQWCSVFADALVALLAASMGGDRT